MAETIRALIEEHARMATLLDLLEAQLTIYRQGGIPDFDLICEVMDYTTSYPERYHHPKENLIFEKIKEKGAEGADLAENLIEEHRKGEDLTNRFAEALGNVALEDPLFGEKLDERYRAFYESLLDPASRPPGR